MNITKNWKMMKLGEIGEIITGITPSTKNENYWGEGYPFVTPSDFTGSKYVTKTERSVTPEGAKTGRIIPKDSVMVTCIATIGEVSLAQSECMTNQQINAIIPGEEVIPQYLYYAMVYSKERLKRYAGITISPIIKKTAFEKFLINIPPLQEQKKIVEILSAVDERIENTNQKIAKVEQLKKGLMIDLIPDNATAKKNGWKILDFGELIADMRNGFASGQRDANGIIQIRMNNVTTDGRLIFDSYLKVPKPKNLEEFLLKKGDLLLNNTNSIDLVGKSAIFNEPNMQCTFSNHFSRFRFKPSILANFVMYYFIMLWTRQYFKSIAIRHVGQAALQMEYLYRLKFPVPPVAEQKKIIEIISTVDGRLESEQQQKEKLFRIKKSLMNDLLSGKKRVRLP